MVDIIAAIDQKEEEQLRSIPAQRLIEKLSLLKNRVDSAKKRWFWELLQNASDYNKSVNVKLCVTDSEVIFYHDGAPFSITDALNLISPDSNKQENQVHTDSIGKFGSGLVSTHILSSTMHVKGLCVNDDSKCYSFVIELNRQCFKEKQALINQIIRAKDEFKTSLKESSAEKGFNTSFAYSLGTALPDLSPMAASDINLDYLYEVLPYTLCFMPKVKTVGIEDKRKKAKIKKIKISRNQANKQEITFSVSTDKNTSLLKFAYFIEGEISSVFRIEEGRILPFPKGISRLFCGLPLIGTEDVGLPILLNSLKFEPTTEREGVELEPGSNETNRKLFNASLSLYSKMLDYVSHEKLRDAYNISKICRKYNGTQASNQQFYNLYLTKYKQLILNNSIVPNNDGHFITFSDTLLPFRDSKSDVQLYENSLLLHKSELPAQEDYQNWFDTTDFSIFTEQKYTYDNLAGDIENKGNIYSFGKSEQEVTSWLLGCSRYFTKCDRFIFSRRKLLPNQSGTLCSSSIFADISLSEDLKNIYDSLYSEKNLKIEDKLLDRNFNQLNLLSQEYTLEMLAKDIDEELSNQFAKNQGDTNSVSPIINRLYNWIAKSEESKENLSRWFHWFYPKRASLIVDMLTETQREYALVIAQSGKMEVLASLASSNLTEENFRFIMHNIEKLPDAISILMDVVDDKTYANSMEGDHGEQLVYKDLLQKYPRSKGYQVVWASKDRNEPCYDFEILKDDKPYSYYDAKTTKRGINNADSIPFFLRKSQWNFIQTLDDSVPYIIGRVFLGDGGTIKYIRITRQNRS